MRVEETFHGCFCEQDSNYTKKKADVSYIDQEAFNDLLRLFELILQIIDKKI